MEYGEVITITRKTGGWVPAAGDFLLPRRYSARVEPADQPEWVIDLDVEVDNYGRATCRSVRVAATENESVTPESVRRLRLGELLRLSARAAMEKVERSESGELAQAPMTAEDALGFYDQFRGGRVPRKGSPLDDEHLQRVADMYRSAISRGEPPTKTIAETLHVARSTAARWVQMARRRGHLGKAKPRRAGEEES